MLLPVAVAFVNAVHTTSCTFLPVNASQRANEMIGCDGCLGGRCEETGRGEKWKKGKSMMDLKRGFIIIISIII